MIFAQKEAKRFVQWLEKYNHHSVYENVGFALLEWLVCDRGGERLDNYEVFLKLVIALLVTESGTLKVGTNVSLGEYMEITMPTNLAGWLPDKEDFYATLRFCKLRGEDFKDD